MCMLAGFRSREMILKFLEYGPDCSLVDKQGQNALHVVMGIQNPNPDVTRALIEQTIDIDARSLDGSTPLHKIIINGHHLDPGLPKLDMMLAAGADIDAVDETGKSLLFLMLSRTPEATNRQKGAWINMVGALVERGASPFVRDFQGCTLLHHYINILQIRTEIQLQQQQQLMETLDSLIELGLDVQAVDFNGNNLIHTLLMRKEAYDASLAPFFPYLIEHLESKGLDMHATNHAGQTVLHLICSTGYCTNGSHRGCVYPFDYIISRTTDLNVVDIQGIAALHMAVAAGMYRYAKKLLDAGADPTILTKQGLSCLHLAARFDHSNMIGLLLDTIKAKTKAEAVGQKIAVVGLGHDVADDERRKSKEATVANSALSAAANADARVSETGISPLFLACVSGRPETVKLLLAAGVDARLIDPLQVCTIFDRVEQLWTRSRFPLFRRSDLTEAEWRTRRQNPRLNEPVDDRMTRLDEILELLIQHGANTTEFLSDTGLRLMRDESQMQNRNYTASCMRKLIHYQQQQQEKQQQQKTSQEKDSQGDYLIVQNLPEMMANVRRDAEIQVLRAQYSGPEPQDRQNQKMMHHLLLRKEYHLIQMMAELGTDFLSLSPDSHVPNLGILIRHGFTALVDKIASIQTQKDDLDTWHAFGDQTQPGLWYARQDVERKPRPFLMYALEHTFPNMDMVELLVNKFHVDVNEILGTKHSTENMNRGYSFLHYVSGGGLWWHARQALPFLLSAGANIEMRNSNGETPLIAALEKSEPNGAIGIFHREAAEILIQAGADTNVVADDGRSCLTFAAHSLQLVQLLLANGARVDKGSLFAAVDNRNPQVLEALLFAAAVESEKQESSNANNSNNNNNNKKSYDRIASNLTTFMYNSGAIESLVDSQKSLKDEEYGQCGDRTLLFHAASQAHIYHTLDTQHIEAYNIANLMIRILIKYKVDPLAKSIAHIPGLGRDPDVISYDLSLSATDTPTDIVPDRLEEYTAAHQVLMINGPTYELLQVPGLDPNHRDAKGRTLLHAACLSIQHRVRPLPRQRRTVGQAVRPTQVDIIRQLGAMGADFHARDNYGRNCLHCLIQSDNVGYKPREHSLGESIAYVVQREPQLLQTADNLGFSPLHYAASFALRIGKPDFVPLLVSKGSDVFAKTNKGDTVLHFLASYLGHEQTLEYFQELVEKSGLDINTRNHQGETPLFCFYNRDKSNKLRPEYSKLIEAFLKTEIKAIEVLSTMGADLFATDHQGRGLLHVAATGPIISFKQLLDEGLDAMMEDSDHRTAIDVAATCGNQDIVKLFQETKDRCDLG